MQTRERPGKSSELAQVVLLVEQHQIPFIFSPCFLFRCGLRRTVTSKNEDHLETCSPEHSSTASIALRMCRYPLGNLGSSFVDCLSARLTFNSWWSPRVSGFRPTPQLAQDGLVPPSSHREFATLLLLVIIFSIWFRT